MKPLPWCSWNPLDPIESRTDAEGRHVLDFGQNVGGYLRFTVEGAAGDVIRTDHSEVLGPHRAFDTRNYRSARAELLYTLKGDGPEQYEPMFTFFGYRHARITVTGEARVVKVQSVPISSVPVQAGGFGCAVPEVDRLVQNTLWSQRGNFIEVPTDCPQRDERLGWTGDAQVFAGTACWLADSESFLRKYLRDVMADRREDGAVPHFSPDPTRMHPMGGGATGRARPAGAMRSASSPGSSTCIMATRRCRGTASRRWLRGDAPNNPETIASMEAHPDVTEQRADVPPGVTDMLPHFQTEGLTAPALEFLSPVKGPALEQITAEVGSGIRPAAEAAALYDQDVEKQAKQLGLPNW